MSRKGLDISLARRRDQEKSKVVKKSLLKKYRNLILVAAFSGGLGVVAANVMTNVKVPIDGPDSPEIPLIQKIKYETFDLFRGDAKDTEPKEEYTPQKDEGYPGIQIKLKPQQELDCDEHQEDCLIS